MTATLGEDLVFDMQARGARTFIVLHGSLDVGDAAKTRVTIGDHRHRNGIANALDLAGEFVQCNEANVGRTKVGVGHAAARDVDRRETRRLDQFCDKTVCRAGDDAGAAGLDQIAKGGCALNHSGLLECGSAAMIITNSHRTIGRRTIL